MNKKAVRWFLTDNDNMTTHNYNDDTWGSPNVYSDPETAVKAEYDVLDPRMKPVLEWRLHLLQCSIVYLASHRAIPNFKKEVSGLLVGFTTAGEWEILGNRLMALTEATDQRLRNFRRYVHVDYYAEFTERIIWENGLPPMLNLRDWFRTKWLNDGFVYRSEITSLVLVRNSYYGSVKLDFVYYTQRFCPCLQEWVMSYF